MDEAPHHHMKKPTQDTNRQFKGVWIPKEIWLDNEITWMEKLLLTEINSLDNEDGCIASNQYFARFFRVSPRQISKYVSRLEEKEKIKVTQVGRNKRKILIEQKFHHRWNKSSITDGTKVPHSNIVNNIENNIPPAQSAEGDGWTDEDLTQYINEKMLGEGAQKHIQVIGTFLSWKEPTTNAEINPSAKMVIPSLKVMQQIIKQHLRAATALAKTYPMDQIEKVIGMLAQYAEWKWELASCEKYINYPDAEILKQLKGRQRK